MRPPSGGGAIEGARRASAVPQPRTGGTVLALVITLLAMTPSCSFSSSSVQHSLTTPAVVDVNVHHEKSHLEKKEVEKRRQAGGGQAQQQRRSLVRLEDVEEECPTEFAYKAGSNLYRDEYSDMILSWVTEHVLDADRDPSTLPVIGDYYDDEDEDAVEAWGVTSAGLRAQFLDPTTGIFSGRENAVYLPKYSTLPSDVRAPFEKAVCDLAGQLTTQSNADTWEFCASLNSDQRVSLPRTARVPLSRIYSETELMDVAINLCTAVVQGWDEMEEDMVVYLEEWGDAILREINATSTSEAAAAETTTGTVDATTSTTDTAATLPPTVTPNTDTPTMAPKNLVDFELTFVVRVRDPSLPVRFVKKQIRREIRLLVNDELRSSYYSSGGSGGRAADRDDEDMSARRRELQEEGGENGMLGEDGEQDVVAVDETLPELTNVDINAMVNIECDPPSRNVNTKCYFVTALLIIDAKERDADTVGERARDAVELGQEDGAYFSKGAEGNIFEGLPPPPEDDKDASSGWNGVTPYRPPVNGGSSSTPSSSSSAGDASPFGASTSTSATDDDVSVITDVRSAVIALVAFVFTSAAFFAGLVYLHHHGRPPANEEWRMFDMRAKRIVRDWGRGREGGGAHEESADLRTPTKSDSFSSYASFRLKQEAQFS